MEVWVNGVVVETAVSMIILISVIAFDMFHVSVPKDGRYTGSHEISRVFLIHGRYFVTLKPLSLFNGK